jgi:hypothetical protein
MPSRSIAGDRRACPGEDMTNRDLTCAFGICGLTMCCWSCLKKVLRSSRRRPSRAAALDCRAVSDGSFSVSGLQSRHHPVNRQPVNLDVQPVRLHRSLCPYQPQMTSYYGEKSRDVPSWESFEAGDDDEVLDRSEVRPTSTRQLNRSTNMRLATTSSSASTPRSPCINPEQIRRMTMDAYAAGQPCIRS